MKTLNKLTVLLVMVIWGTSGYVTAQTLTQHGSITDDQRVIVEYLGNEIANELEMVKEGADFKSMDNGEVAKRIEYSGEYNSEYLFKSVVGRVVNGYSDVKMYGSFERNGEWLQAGVLINHGNGEVTIALALFSDLGDRQVYRYIY